MKKLHTILMTSVMCLSLSACSQFNSSAPSSSVSEDEAVWPSGDVTLYVPARAGGGTDMLARLYASTMNEITGANVVVVNDTTGANSVAYETVRNAKPDGQTLMVYHGGLCSQHAFGQYAHSLEEFDVLSTLSKDDPSGVAMLVNGDSQFQTFEDFVSYAKENPGAVTVGVETNGVDQLLMTMLQKQLGIECTVVSAGSNTEKIPLILGGNLDVFFTAPTMVEDYLNAGSLRALVMAGTERNTLVPDVPYLEELGYDSILFPGAMFLAGPADMPLEIRQAINDVLKKTGEDAELVEALQKLRMDWDHIPLEECDAYAKETQSIYVEAVKLLQSGD